MNRRANSWKRVSVLLVAITAAGRCSLTTASDLFAGLGDSSDAGRTYAIFDALALQRNNGSTARPLVTDIVTGDVVLSSGDLNPDVGVGPRILFGRRVDADWGWEAGYFGIYDMNYGSTLTAPGTLAIDGPLGEGTVGPLSDADRVVANYSSSINSAEFNTFRSVVGGGLFSPGGWREGWGFDWLQGWRYVSLAEQAGMAFTCCTGGPQGGFTSRYDVATSNNLIGWQLGGRGRYSWSRWAIEGWGKAGIYANVQTQNQDPIIDPIGVGFVAREARYSQTTTPAMVADLNLSLVRRLNNTWAVRAGYNMVWIGGVALAPDQWDFDLSETAGTRLDSGSWVFLGGGNLGLEARW